MSGARSSYNNDPEMGVELLELPPTNGSNTHATTTGSSPRPDEGLMIPVRLASAQVPVVDGALDTPEAQGQEQDPVAPAPVRRGFWAFVEKLDFSWYAWPISIGVTSILIHECSVSYPQYHKLLTTTVFFYLVIDVIMFSVITGLTVTRYCRWPNLFSATMKHRRQVGLFAMVPMALGTIINMSTRLVDDNKQTVTTVIWVFWLIEVVLSLVAEIGLTLILPVAAPITAAAAGSDLIVKLGAGLASATFWISYITLALGSFHAMATYPAELVRLAKLLGKRRLRIEHILDIFIPLTALAQSGMAAQQLGAQALRLSNIIPPSWENKGLTSSNLSIVSHFSSFTCWGFSLLYFAGSLVFLWLGINMLRRGSFNNSWLAIPFSIGFFALSTLRLVPRESNRGFEMFGIVLAAIAVTIFNVFWVKACRSGWAGNQTPLFNTRPGAERDHPASRWYQWLLHILEIILNELPDLGSN
ncbi:hypothetical protein CHU98_g3593 [Xylaria longipes]|nr:hypothetical protein CHU98_g3593 [Xylaria longipes]